MPASATSPSPTHIATTRRLGVAGLSLAGAGALIVVLLHVLPQTSSISPMRRTISEYALSPIGWTFEAAMVIIGVGSAILAVVLVRSGIATSRSTAVIGVLIWAVSLIGLAVFTKHDWSVGPTFEGQVHRVFSLTAFIALPFAALAAGRRWATSALVIPARLCTALGALSLLWFAPLLGAILLAPVTGTPWYRAIPLGFVERGLAGAEFLALLALAFLAFAALKHPGIQPAPAAAKAPAAARSSLS